MAYTKTNWVDKVTPLSAANMNKIEDELSILDETKVNKPTVLYDSSTGSSSSVTLSDSAANYTELEIYYRRTTQAYSSVKVTSPNGKLANMMLIYYLSDILRIYSAIATISGSTITIGSARYVNISGTTINANGDDTGNIFITKVVGYK